MPMPSALVVNSGSNSGRQRGIYSAAAIGDCELGIAIGELEFNQQLPLFGRRIAHRLDGIAQQD
jgi:hypothetical protein